MVALGASALQTASAQTLQGPDGEKPWSVSATVRGFYDDNVSTLPDEYEDSSYDLDSFGYELSPSARLNLVWPQTTLSLGYVYSFKYYENRPPLTTDKDAQSHMFNAAIAHNFNERYRISVDDSFVIGQEPDLLRAGNTFSTFQRVEGDNIRNFGRINFDADLSRLFAAQVGYANAYWNFDDSGVGSLSSLLDRMEHTAHIDGKWKATPKTTGILGYQYGQADYLSDDPMALIAGTLAPIDSDYRNSRSHYVYAGVDHSFTPDLVGSLRAGGRFIDYYNADEDSISPYVLGSLRYTYGPENSVEAGFIYDRTATDVSFQPGNTFVASLNQLTLDAETFTIFAELNHRIASRLYGNLTAQFQNNVYEGGALDGTDEQIFLAGLELEYRFSKNFSAHAGYNYDTLESDMDFRSFDRNRVYLGLTASY